jgi:hypothetical protein
MDLFVSRVKITDNSFVSWLAFIVKECDFKNDSH